MLEDFLEVEAFRNWFEELGWKPEEVTDTEYNREILPDGEFIGTDGQKWEKVKIGTGITMKICRSGEMRESKFDVSEGQWKSVA